MAYRSGREKPVTTVTYDGIEIGYYESDNQWSFVLRGRERTVESLAKAKEAIDKPVAEKKPVFEKQEGFMFDIHWNGDKSFKVVTITSLIEGGHYAWVVSPKGDRSKESSSLVYLDTADNLKAREEWVKLNIQKLALEKAQSEIVKNFKAADSLAKETAE